MLSQRSLGASGFKPLPSDDEFNRVSFLSHFNGANNGVNNVFDDGSASNHTITANGNVTQGSFGPFAREEGAWGWSFDSSAEGLVLNYGSTSHNYWNGDFTWEFWVNTTDVDSINVLFGCWVDNGMSGGSYAVGFSADGKINVSNRESSAANQGAFITSATAINDGAWHHIAITQVDDGGSTKYFRIFVDGVLDAYDTETSWTQGTSGQEITIGGLSIIASSYEAARRYTGLISNWRIVESIVYSTASTTIGATIFTPPTGPLTAISNTRILSCQSNKFVDNSANAYAITSNGNGKTTSFGPFLTSEVYDPAVNAASGYFDGTGDFLTAPASSDFAAGTGDFTVEYWLFPTDWSQTYYPNYIVGATFGLWIGKLSNNFAVHAYGGTTQLIHGTLPTLNSWTHIAVSRSGTTLKLFYNGTNVSTSTSSYNFAQGELRIGTDENNGNYTKGLMSNVRYVKGTAVYTSNFTPPTAPLTAITNTKLLLNMADGQAIDSAAQNNLTLADDVKLSTAKAKFGDTSMLFDGSGKAYIESSNVVNFGSGDFTVEFFMNITTGGAEEVVFDARNPSQGAYFDLELDTSNRLNYYVLNGIRITSSALSTNTWYHVAVCRSGTSTKMFIDGTQAGSTYSDSTVYLSTNRVVLGGYSNSATYDFDGYLDEIRVSKTARYTSNFTPPTAAFANKGQ